MTSYLAQGMLIGIIFGMPIGAVGALCMQRTIHHGIYAGLVTGLASSSADMLYACAGAFGMTLISDFLVEYQQPIHTIGALLLMIIAFRMIGRKEEQVVAQPADAKSFLHMFISSFLVAIANPAAAASFLFAFSVFGITGVLNLTNGIQLGLGIFFGTFLWWLLLSNSTAYLKKRCSVSWYGNVNAAFGIILIIFSIGILLHTC